MVKLNLALLPVKLHYFFFLGAMGPILPFLSVFGKQLGVSELAMGIVNAVIPLLFLIIKPFFGYILDYFQSRRKLIFLLILMVTSILYLLMCFVPNTLDIKMGIACSELEVCRGSVLSERYCAWQCGNVSVNVQADLTGPKPCFVNFTNICPLKNETCLLTCATSKRVLYTGYTFWAFVILMSLGTIGYNVSNCISDAICFDVLGPGNESRYGNQRVWGTIGFGITALLGSYLINILQGESSSTQDYLPALLLGIFCMVIDLICCLKLKLPPMPKSENIVKDTYKLLKQPHIAVFIFFAICVGICDSSVIFYLLWYLEDLAKETNQTENIKLLEGLTVALETLCGEVIFFPISGLIVRKIGYGHCFTMCFAIYSLRLALFYCIPSPWWILPVETFLQGPTYALFYATIVAYASAIAPPGTSATIQGVVAGMDDGVGFCIGNLIGGALYKCFGGKKMFLIFSIFALSCSVSHCCLYHIFKQPTHQMLERSVSRPLEKKNVDVIGTCSEVTTFVPTVEMEKLGEVEDKHEGPNKE